MGIGIGSVTSKGVTTEDSIKQKAYHLLPCTITVEVDLMLGLFKSLEDKLGAQLLVQPQLCTALAAAIIAEESQTAIL